MKGQKLRHTHSSARASKSAPFVETRPNAWAAQIGFMHGRGYSTALIADRLGDTHAATIAKMIQHWGLPRSGRRQALLQVPIGIRDRANVCARALQHDIEPTEFCRRILIATTMPIDLYDAIIEDPRRFE